MLERIIKEGENDKVEFKETFRYDIKTNQKNKALKKEVTKAIAGFLNHQGGILLIGVNDDCEIEGLSRDLNTYGEESKIKKRDNLLKDINTTCRKHLGTRVIGLLTITYETVKEEEIIMIEVSPSDEAVFDEEDVFYLRNGPETITLVGQDLANYILKRYGRTEQLEESRLHLDEETFLSKARELEKDFDQNITFQKVKSDLNFRNIVYPLSPKGELFNIGEISELKDYLEKVSKYGPYFDGIPTPLFDDLRPNREGLQYIATTELIGSVLIQREGLVLYDWRYGMKKDPDNETLPVHLMAGFYLGILYFLSNFFTKVKYFDKIKIILRVSNLSNWQYSPHPKFMFNRPKYNFLHSSFRPIERIIAIRELLTKEVKEMILQETFNEILLCYGDSKGFSLPENLKKYLEEH